MAYVEEFVAFNQLTDELKMQIINKIDSSKDFIRFITSGIPHGMSLPELNSQLKTVQNADYYRLINTLYQFTYECVGLEKKFLTDKEARNKHFDMFMNGYPQSNILENDMNFKAYNDTFDDMVYDLATSMQDPSGFYNTLDTYSMYAEILNKLRFKKGLTDDAQHMLFKKLEDDVVKHQLNLVLESGAKISIIITYANQEDTHVPFIDIQACFDVYDNKQERKQYKIKLTVSEEIEDEDDDGEIITTHVNSDPTEWIVPFLRSLQSSVGEKMLLGDVKSIQYNCDGERFWMKAYMLLDVLPRLNSKL
jgi:hypothetical protein